MRFFRGVLKSFGEKPRTIVTDKLKNNAAAKNYAAAKREMNGGWIHDMSQYSNSRVEQSRQPIRGQERNMRRFHSLKQIQKFLNVHAAVYNLLNLGRHLTIAQNYQNLTKNSFNQ